MSPMADAQAQITDCHDGRYLTVSLLTHGSPVVSRVRLIEGTRRKGTWAEIGRRLAELGYDTLSGWRQLSTSMATTLVSSEAPAGPQATAVVDAYDVTITPAAALLFNTATACADKANSAYYTGKHNPKMMDRMASRALDSAARALGIHRDDIMPVYNLHRGLPIAIGKHIVRPA